MKKSTLVILWLSAFAQTPWLAIAAPVGAMATVKVRSGICGQNETKFRGSGFLLRDGGRLFVITSDHVVVNTNDRFCHSIWSPVLGTVKTRLLMSDWGAGLALLEVPNAPKRAMGFTLDDLQGELPASGQKLVAAGYPWELHVPFSHRGGNVVQVESDRHIFAHTGRLIEILGANSEVGVAEFGMSGGPVLDPSEERVVGLLSHQALLTVTGRPKRVVEIDGAHTGQVFNHVFVIPSAFIRTWLGAFLEESGGFQPLASEIGANQLTGRQTVVTEGLQFEMSTVGASGLGAVGGKGGGDPTGVGGKSLLVPATGVGGKGGGDPTGVGGGKGGGDPTGVGGAAVEISIALESDDPVIIVTLPPRMEYPGSLHMPSRLPWVQAIRDALFLRKKVIIPYLFRRTVESGAPERVGFTGLAPFFRALAESNVVPVTRLIEPGEKRSVSNHPFGEGPALDELKHAVMIFTGLKRTIESRLVIDPKLENAADMLVLINRALFTLEVLQSASWDTIRAEEIAEMIARKGSYSAGLSELFYIDFDHSRDGMETLQRLLDRLRKHLK